MRILRQFFIVIFIALFFIPLLANTSVLDKNSTEIDETFIRPTISPLYCKNWDDQIPENRLSVYSNSASTYQSLGVGFNLAAHGLCLVTGVSYKYNNIGIGPYNLNITYWGEDLTGAPFSYGLHTLDSGIPQVGADSWRTLYHHNDYLIDDDPIVQFNSTDSSSSCVQICADTPSIGNSWFDNGSGYVIDSNYEYMVELIVEEIPTLNPHEIKSGNIVGSDYVDAYFVYLQGRHEYGFYLNRSSGTGELKMRLVQYHTITNNVLKETDSFPPDDFPRYFSYMTWTSGMYVLLVEPESYGVDFAEYTITCKLEQLYSIYSEADLALTADYGFGNETNPYIIEDKIFSCYDKKRDYSLAIVPNSPINSHLIIRNCTIFGYSYGGIRLSNINNCTIFNTTIYDAPIGVHCITNCFNLRILNCTFHNCGEGIVCCDGMLVSNNSFYDNTIGISVESKVSCTFIGNVANNNSCGISLSGATNCYFSNNSANHNTGNGFYLIGASNNTFIGNFANFNNEANGFLIEDFSNL